MNIPSESPEADLQVSPDVVAHERAKTAVKVRNVLGQTVDLGATVVIGTGEAVAYGIGRTGRGIYEIIKRGVEGAANKRFPSLSA